MDSAMYGQFLKILLSNVRQNLLIVDYKHYEDT